MAEVAAHLRSGSAAGQPYLASASASASASALQRQPSFSSFPSSRPPSAVSHRNDSRKARSPQPPMVREDDASTSSSIDSSVGLEISHRAPGKLRSQYPANSPENHVEYILVASFDIDRGSVMEHQYPTAISGDETMLAELMLPDQAHVRAQDWTIFFLHKDTTTAEDEDEARRERRRKRKRRKQNADNGGDTTPGAEYNGDDCSDSDSHDEMDSDGPPLVYVLNLVNTKQDNTVKRFIPYRSELTPSHVLANTRQRCHCQSHGHLHKTPIPAHIQATVAARSRGIFSSTRARYAGRSLQFAKRHGSILATQALVFGNVCVASQRRKGHVHREIRVHDTAAEKCRRGKRDTVCRDFDAI